MGAKDSNLEKNDNKNQQQEQTQKNVKSIKNFSEKFNKSILPMLQDPTKLKMLVVFGIGIVGILFGAVPLRYQTKQLEKQLDTEIQRNKVIIDIEKLQHNLDFYNQYLNPDADITWWIKYLLNNSRENNLRLISYVPRPVGKLANNDRYEGYYLRFNIEGTFANTMKFIHWIETNKWAMRIIEARIQKSKKDETILTRFVIALLVSIKATKEEKEANKSNELGTDELKSKLESIKGLEEEFEAEPELKLATTEQFKAPVQVVVSTEAIQDIKVKVEVKKSTESVKKLVKQSKKSKSKFSFSNIKESIINKIIKPSKKKRTLKKVKKQPPVNAKNIDVKYKELEGHYTVQIASYPDNNYPTNEVEQIKKLGYDVVFYGEADIKILYAGKFQDMKSAKTALENLKETFKDAFIKKIRE